jgi:chromosome condensin MukBEF ATPase and DNA-binding subunit MukB
MKNVFKGLSLALVAALLLTSCAKQPTQQIDAAKAAIQSVVDAKGETYAPDELANLNAQYQQAMDEVNAQSKKFFKKYGKAKEELAKVITDAEAVKALIPARVEEAKNQAVAAQTDAQTAYDTAKALLEKAPKGKGTKADIEAMKADLSGLETQLTEVQDAIASENYVAAKDKALVIKDKANAIAQEVEAAIAKVRR